MLASRLGSFEELRVADLFAGTGALGLEALSRGAAHCTFVESDPLALKALRSNIEKLAVGDAAQILAQPVEAMMTAREPCHLLRSEEHTSELQSLMRNSYAVFCLKKKNTKQRKKAKTLDITKTA